MKKILQKISLWVLKKTNYEHKIELDVKFDDFDIHLIPVGLSDKPKSHDITCKNKKIGYLNRVHADKIFRLGEEEVCPNKEMRMIRFDTTSEAKLLKENYEKIISEVKKSVKVIIK